RSKTVDDRVTGAGCRNRVPHACYPEFCHQLSYRHKIRRLQVEACFPKAPDFERLAILRCGIVPIVHPLFRGNVPARTYRHHRIKRELIMKTLVSLAAVALLVCGCATQRQVAGLKGHGSREVFRAPFEQVWRAAVDAAQIGDLEILNADRNAGYIAAKRGIRMETFGEYVDIWVSRLSPSESDVNVVSRQAGPPKFHYKNWEHA